MPVAVAVMPGAGAGFGHEHSDVAEGHLVVVVRAQARQVRGGGWSAMVKANDVVQLEVPCGGASGVAAVPVAGSDKRGHCFGGVVSCAGEVTPGAGDVALVGDTPAGPLLLCVTERACSDEVQFVLRLDEVERGGGTDLAGDQFQ